MKPPTACLQCRDRKVACRPSSQPESCHDCRRRNKPCSFSKLSRNPNALKSEDQGAIPLRILQLTTAEQMIDDYIHFMHDRPHSLFHTPTLRHSVRKGTLDRALLLAICALGCRFSAVSMVRDGAQELSQRAMASYQQNMDHPCLESFQTCILLAHLCATSSRPFAEASYYGSAFRMAYLLRLNETNFNDDPILRETKKRGFLSLFMGDKWHSFSVALPTQLSDDSLPKEPAIDEAVFHRADYGDIKPQHTEPGLWAYRIELAKILGQIQELNRYSSTRIVGEIDDDLAVRPLEQALLRWEATLPDHVAMITANLESYHRKGQAGCFIDLHLGFHYYAMLLYFRFLGKQRPCDQRRHPFVENCKDHALAYSRLLSESRSTAGFEVMHCTVGHMTVISSAVLLYLLLSGNEAEMNQARQSLVSNFQAIIHLQTCWPALSRWVERLSTFQQACRDWPIDIAFQMDSWMLRFLLEYSLPLQPKNSGAVVYSPPSMLSAGDMSGLEIERGAGINVLDKFLT